MEKRTKIAFYLFAAFMGFTLAHNLAFSVLKFEDILFFYLAVASFFAFLIYFIYGTVYRLLKGEPLDWWKLGFLGLVGLLGFIPRFGPNLYGFYGFFGLFGFRKR